jgi:hypothetical protein
MKGLPDGRGLRFPIRDEALNVIGFLRGFDKFSLEDDGLIETMARSRTMYRESFMTQFVVTPENKRGWLENSILNNDDRMLFLVETEDGRVVGQDGFSLGAGGVFRLDGSMRWGRGGHSGLFHRGGVERASMGFFLLLREKCVVEIFKKNVLVLDNSFCLGFKAERELALSMSEEDGVVSFAKETDPSRVNTDEALLSLSLDRETFAELNKTILENPCWGNAFDAPLL